MIVSILLCNASSLHLFSVRSDNGLSILVNAIIIHRLRNSADLALMSLRMRKLTMWFPNRSEKNRAVQSQKKAKSLKFRIYEEEVYYIYIRLAKPTALTAKLIWVFVFAYADCWFSHGEAYLVISEISINLN